MERYLWELMHKGPSDPLERNCNILKLGQPIDRGDR